MRVSDLRLEGLCVIYQYGMMHAFDASRDEKALLALDLRDARAEIARVRNISIGSLEQITALEAHNNDLAEMNRQMRGEIAGLAEQLASTLARCQMLNGEEAKIEDILLREVPEWGEIDAEPEQSDISVGVEMLAVRASENAEKAELLLKILPALSDLLDAAWYERNSFTDDEQALHDLMALRAAKAKGGAV